MWIKYYFFDIINSNWLDIGVNDSLHNHTINIARGLIEFAPLDLILDAGATVYLLIGLVVFYIVVVRNFMKGYRGEVKREYAPLPTKPLDPNFDYEGMFRRWEEEGIFK